MIYIKEITIFQLKYHMIYDRTPKYICFIVLLISLTFSFDDTIISSLVNMQKQKHKHYNSCERLLNISSRKKQRIKITNKKQNNNYWDYSLFSVYTHNKSQQRIKKKKTRINMRLFTY